MLRRRRSGCEAPTDATPPCPLESISAQRRLVAAAYEQRAEVAPRAGRASYMLSLSRATKPTRCQTRSATPHAGSRGSRHRTGLVACGPHARTPKLSAKLQQSRNPSGSCSAAQSFRSITASTHSPGPGLTWHAGGAQLGSPGRQRTRRRRPGISAATRAQRQPRPRHDPHPGCTVKYRRARDTRVLGTRAPLVQPAAHGAGRACSL